MCGMGSTASSWPPHGGAPARAAWEQPHAMAELPHCQQQHSNLGSALTPSSQLPQHCQQQDSSLGGCSSVLTPSTCCGTASAGGAGPAELRRPAWLVCGTSAGVFGLDTATGCVELLGLAGLPVAQVAYDAGSGLLLAAVPVCDEALHAGPEQAQAAVDVAGLYALQLNGRSSSTDSTLSSSALCDGAGAASPGRGSCFGGGGGSVAAMKLYDGNARCCAFAPPARPAPGCEGPRPLPRIFVGVQPADVLVSHDLGGSWASCGLAAAPQANADQWFRRLPPYESRVRSISVQRGDGDGAAAEQQQAAHEQEQLLVSVEVGGVLCGTSDCAWQDGVGSWQDCSHALCRDVHGLQPDPFNARRLYAVTGSGSLPGGVYRTSKGSGGKWRRLFGYRYSVGLALSATQRGRVLLTSADKPPTLGCHLFESVDGGRSFATLTDEIADAAAAVTGHDPGLLAQPPVAMFVPGGLILACVTGHVLLGTAQPLGGYESWRLLATLPAHAVVSCTCTLDGTAAAASLARS